MKCSLRILTALYAICMHLYPKGYKNEYGDELKIVFELSLREAAQKGGSAIIGLACRELYSLPQAIIYEHWRERRIATMLARVNSYFTFEPGTWHEVLAALAPFLLFSVFSTCLSILRRYDIIPHWLDVVIAILMLGLFLTLSGIGIFKRIPRWFLPYLGLPLALFSVYVFLGLIANPPYEIQLRPNAPWLLRHFVYQGQLWVGLLVAAAFLVLISRLLPSLHPFYWRLRQDWTLLSFMLYGATIFALLLTFDDYVNDELFQIAAMLLLAGGAWFYLRGTHSRRRFLALIAGLTLATAVATIGKAILYSSPNWPYPRHFTWQTEAMGTIIMGVWLGIIISAPLLLTLTPSKPNKSLRHSEMSNT